MFMPALRARPGEQINMNVPFLSFAVEPATWLLLFGGRLGLGLKLERRAGHCLPPPSLLGRQQGRDLPRCLFERLIPRFVVRLHQRFLRSEERRVGKECWSMLLAVHFR